MTCPRGPALFRGVGPVLLRDGERSAGPPRRSRRTAARTRACP